MQTPDLLIVIAVLSLALSLFALRKAIKFHKRIEMKCPGFNQRMKEMRQAGHGR